MKIPKLCVKVDVKGDLLVEADTADVNYRAGHTI